LRGVSAKAQVSFPVSYKGQYLGEYVADLVVEGKVIVELKCVDRFSTDHVAQCINYLKALVLGSPCSSIFKDSGLNGNGFSSTGSVSTLGSASVCHHMK
jgi:PD-(D/E)XK nuclease superfamily